MNKDSGDNGQLLKDGSGQNIHGALVSPGAPSTYHYLISPSNIISGELQLDFTRTDGYRVTVAEVLLTEKTSSADTLQSVTITSPIESAALTGGSLIVTGTATDSERVGSQVEIGITAIADGITHWFPVSQWQNNNQWRYHWSLPSDGLYNLSARVRNSQNKTLSAAVVVTVDQNPPVDATYFFGTDVADDDGSRLLIQWQASASTDIVGYQLERRPEMGVFAFITALEQTSTQYQDNSVVKDVNYIYRLIAIDHAGNKSAGVSSLAVMAKDNNGDGSPPEDITDLRLTASDAEVYLSWQPSVDSANDLTGYLVDVSLNDGVIWGNNAPAFDNSLSIKLNRNNSSASVSSLTNGDVYRFRVRAVDGASNISSGVISSTVSPTLNAVIAVSGVLSEDTYWRRGVYYVNGDVTVAAGKTLSIAAGVIVKFGPSRSLKVQGTLNSYGTEAEPVYFTAYNDDAVGGDSNTDGASSAPSPGYWHRVWADDNASLNLIHTKVRYGGLNTGDTIYGDRNSWLNLSHVESSYNGGIGVYAYYANLEVNDSSFHHNLSHGIAVYGSSYQNEIKVKNSTASHNEQSGFYMNSSSMLIELEANTFEHNKAYGVYSNQASTGFSHFKNNVVRDNVKAVRLPFSALPDIDDNNLIKNNTKQDIELIGNELTRSVKVDTAFLHRVVSGIANIKAGALVTIPAGAIWKFHSGTYMQVYGALNAVGTVELPIYFTSYRDDTLGGDSNGDGFSDGVAGDWNGIRFEDTVVDALTQLRHVKVRFAGQSQAALYVNRANITLADSEITDSGHHGIETYYASPIITRNRIIKAKKSGVYVSNGSYPLIDGNEISGASEHGIYVYSSNSSPEINNNRIEGNKGWGIYFRATVTGPVLKNNIIINNKRGLTIPASMMPNVDDGNTLVPNTLNAIWLRGQGVARDLTLAQLSHDNVSLNTYVVMGSLGVNSGYRLTISPGVVMKFQPSAELWISGELGSVGTSESPIVYTSYADDSVGGDTNGDGYASMPASGDWYEVRFNDSAIDDASPMEHVEVRYAGQSNRAGIQYYGSNQRLAHAKVSYSGYRGIYSYNSTLTLEDVDIVGNRNDGIYGYYGTVNANNVRIFANGGHGVKAERGTVNLNGGEVFSNNGHGAYLGTSATITVDDIWWGAADGAGGTGGGSGDEINAGVDNSNQRTDGTEYSYFNAGGIDSSSYGMVIPVVSGIASQQWGDSAVATVHYEQEAKSINVEYTGLDTNATYQLFATFYNVEEADVTQNITAENDSEIITDFTIQQSKSQRLEGIVSAEMIQDGYLQFNINRNGGFRTHISELLLIKNELDNRSLSITLNSPLDGTIIGKNGVVLSGVLAEQHINEKVDIGFSKSGGSFVWLPVNSQNSAKWSHFWLPEYSAQYSVKARLKQPSGEFVFSDTINLTASIEDPAAVERLFAASSDGKIRLDWQLSSDDSASILQYQILRRDGASFELIASVGPQINTYLDEQVVLEQDYYYFVRVINTANTFSDSHTVGPIIILSAPDTTPPNEVMALNIDYSLNHIDQVTSLIRWNAPTENSVEVTEYRVYASTDQGENYDSQFARLESDTTAYLAKGLNSLTSYTFKITTVDMFGNESAGNEVSFTPVAGIAKAIALSGSLSHDLLLDEGVYYIASQYIVPEGINLTVANGTVVKFGANAVLYVSGKLLTQGDEGNLVTFTAVTDDVAGDTNGDADSSIATAGYWRGISTYSNKGQIELNYAQVSYAGSSSWSVYASYGSLDLNHVKITHGKGQGVEARRTSLSIINSLIDDVTGHGIYLYYTNVANIHNNIIKNAENAIYSIRSRPSIIGNTLVNNSNYAIYFQDTYSGPRLKSNTIQNNDIPMRIPAAMFPDSSNVLFPNRVNRFRILGGILAENSNFASYHQDDEQLAEYVIENSDLTLNANQRLDIDPGVVVKLSANVQLTVNGMLSAQGTIEQPIIFTSSHDDSVIGDSNANGNATTPQRGDWKRLYFSGGALNSQSKLSHVKIRFAGASYAQALSLNGASAEIAIDNVEISNTKGDAVYLYNVSPTITNSSFWANSNLGINVQGNSAPKITFSGIMLNGLGGIKVAGSASPVISNTRFFSNNQYAINSSSTELTNAEYNWWGDFDNSGPEHLNNPIGNGEKLSGNINFGEYVAANNLDYLYVNFDENGVVRKGNMPAVEILQGSLINTWDIEKNHPSKTALIDENLIHLKLSGLDPAKSYKLGLTYFNGDQSDTSFNLTDGLGNPIHSTQVGPKLMPTLYNFLLPSAYYAAGEIEIKLHHESAATAFRAAITELFLVEAIEDFTPPKFENIALDDQDGSETLTAGDVLHFNLSEEVQLIADKLLIADQLFITELSKSFGAINEVVWSADKKSLAVTLTTGFTIESNEVITIQGLTDLSGYPVIGAQAIELVDTRSPEIIDVEWIDVDSSGQLTLGDQYKFTFSEVMDPAHLSDNTTDANANLRPYAGRKYGSNNIILWSDDNRSVLVTITEGFTIQGDEVVLPNAFITDKAGNAATGEAQLQGKDVTQPSIIQIEFDDANGDGAISIGDRYRFSFSEPIQVSALTSQTNEANTNLSPQSRLYGEVNIIVCEDSNSVCTVTITEGFTIEGNELVTPSAQLTDRSENVFDNTGQLTLVDSIKPKVIAIEGTQNNPVDSDNSYQLSVQFNSSMKTEQLPKLAFSSLGLAPATMQLGSWQSTVFPNDTFVSESIALSHSMTKAINVVVSGSKDLVGNVMDVSADLLTIMVQPSMPGVYSFLAAPQINFVNQQQIPITGSRQYNTAIYLNGALIVAADIGDWQYVLNLPEGISSQRFRAANESGAQSSEVVIHYTLDSIAPTVASVTPTNNSYFKAAPNDIIITFIEIGTGIDLDASSIELTKLGVSVSGQLIQNIDELVFTPSTQLTNGEYHITSTLVDRAGWQSTENITTFVIDNLAPAIPTINALAEISNNLSINISGTKEAGTGIKINGQVRSVADGAQVWQADITLVVGENLISVSTFDYAGNESSTVLVNVFFDDTAPGLVPLVLISESSGTELTINWQSYNELANGGDISRYRIYLANQEFTQVSGASMVAVIDSPQKSYQIANLMRGTTYHVAVLAVDSAENSLATFASQAVTMSDQQAPANISSLNAISGLNQLTISWLDPIEGYEDLAGYRLYVDGGAAIELTGNTTEYVLTGLISATAYQIKVTTIDVTGNESEGVTRQFVTLLTSPTGIITSPLSGKADVSWNSTEPAHLVSGYKLYADTQTFTDVTHMQARASVSANKLQAIVNGLQNEQSYYIGVSVINSSGAESKIVTSVQVTPTSDNQGPEVQTVKWSNLNLNVQGTNTITASGTLIVTASDESGVAAVAYLLDGSPLGQSTNSSTSFNFPVSIEEILDGAHTLTVTLWDSLDNETSVEYPLTVAMSVPSAPKILQPIEASETNIVNNLVQIKANAGQEVQLTLNGNAGTWQSVAQNGLIEININFSEGVNTLTALAKNRGGLSVVSTEVTVTLDSSLPDAPSNFYGVAKEAAVINLSWAAVADESSITYQLYRSSQPFTDINNASKINAQPLTLTNYTDIPEQDGQYYYRVLAVNELSTRGHLSDQISLNADSELPFIEQIVFTPLGQYDATNKVYGQGKIEIRVVVNEPLLTRPFLSLTPEGIAPLSIDLFKVTEFEYQAEVDIPADYVSGVAFALFSARDLVGNRGTEVKASDKITIDTLGPRVQHFEMTPVSPVKNDTQAPTALNFTVEFNESIDAETLTLHYQIGAAEKNTIDNLLQQSATKWSGTVTLDPNTGLEYVEYLQLSYQVKDHLANEKIAKLNAKAIQVYQGDLPPLDVPFGLQASILPEGKVQLTWYQVPDAAGYQIYRRGTADPEMTLVTEVIDVLNYTDTPLTDGEYLYAITSIRVHDGMTTYSARSAEVSITTDSVAPEAPFELTAELMPQGVGLRWNMTNAISTTHYRLYRDDAIEITDVSSLTPLIDKIYSIEALDTLPSAEQSGYVITALDQAGNESAVSNTVYLNVSLLPVNQLNITQVDNAAPIIQWQHSGTNINGYDIYLEQGDISLKLNPERLVEKSYVDSGFNNNSREYRLIAIDNNSVESLARNIILPHVAIEPVIGSKIEKGIMNELHFKVSNNSQQAFLGAELNVLISGREHISTPFDLAAGASTDIAIIVGGYSELLAQEDITATLIIKPTITDSVNIVRSFTTPTVEGSYVLRVETDAFMQGGLGKVRLIIENPTDLDIEVETASNSGNADSSAVQFTLLDLDGNVLAVTGLRQVLGEHVILTSSGKLIARIPAGQSFTSQWVEMQLPVATPEQAILETSINNFTYHQGRNDEVKISGLSNRQPLNTEVLPYYAEVSSISPQTSYGDQAITITGNVVERESMQTLANTPFSLVFNINGFERVIDLISDTNGDFSYDYQPQAGESGVYHVSAIYPKMTDRPDHGEFVVGHLSVNYSRYNLTLPKELSYQLPLVVSNGKGADYQDLYWSLTSVPASGIHLTLPTATTIVSEQKLAFAIDFIADDIAAETGSLTFALKSASTGDEVLSSLEVNYQLSPAAPVLYYSPAQVETGLTVNGQVEESFALENRGTADMLNVNVQLLNGDNSLAPNWVSLNGSNALGNLAVGDSVNVNITVAPQGRANPDVYHLKLRVSSANHVTREIPVIIAVSEDGVGGIQFKLADIYTATLNEQGEIIKGLQGASISLQNLDVPEYNYQASTDELGELYYPEIQAGNYRYRISASNHEALAGQIRILPGIVRNLDLFLPYNLVSVEWQVNEIVLEDRYEIVLSGTFETDVPAAVVIMEPFSIRLPDMRKGDVLNGEITLTNYGLIRADNLKMHLPQSDDFFRYEFLSSVIPETLAAKQSIVLPYRVISLESFNPAESGNVSGSAGCSSYTSCVSETHDFSCASGDTSSGSSRSCFTLPSTSSCSVSGGGGGGWGGGWGGGSGGSWGDWVSEAIPENMGLGGCRDDDEPCAQEGNGSGQ